MSTKPAVPEVALARGGVRAVISTSSAAVRELTVDGHPLLRSFAQGTHPPQAANIILAPWPNRVADAAFTFRGRRHELAATEPARGHAIHGFTVRRIFDIVEHSPDAAVLRTVLGPEPGWPWPIELTVRYALTDSGLEAAMTAVNLADEPAPCALGVHTYLDAQGAPLDECTLHHTIAERQPVNERLIPAGAREPWPHGPIPMQSTVLDDAGYDPLHRPHLARLVDASGTGVELEATSSLPWTQLFTSPQRHLAVEPMTAPPNALNTGEDLTVLAPGGALEVGWSVRAIASDN
ncbi:aldose 1-epimerase family protein [Corynebacterium appendicis]|uniref:aldose 1-epimerase family protein n=1 Tax=Corynebacterium appendicis TaxID=163202 RepID=UPI00254E3453|nr:aldose 1-epimerase family protein [Corynebacterium appendicis]MDK8626080.1 aldose 1-epimerase family protein [Corynebacterium appendicis]